MATVEWIDGEGRTCVFYSETSLVVVDGASRPATEAEVASATAYLESLEVGPPPTPVLSTREVLTQALTTLRQVTADQVVTQQEAGAALVSTIPALEAFRDLEEWDEDAVKLTILLLSQAVQALYIMGAQSAQLYAGIGQTVTELNARVTALEP